MAVKWHEIPGLGGMYFASRGGEIYSAYTDKVLKQPVGRSGYPQISTYVNGARRTRPVHLLVARTFLGPAPEGMEARHLNGNRLDPRLENLRYGTKSENMQDKRTHGTNYELNKEQCPIGHMLIEPNLVKRKIRADRDCLSCNRTRALARHHGEDFDPEKAHARYRKLMK